MRIMRVVAALGLLAAPLAAQDAPRTVSVVGSGQVSVVPDVANVSYTVIDQGAPTVGMAALVDQNTKRVKPTVEYLKSVVGSNGTVTVTPRVQRVEEYDQTLRKSVFKGYQVVSSIQVELCGTQNIEQNLSKLFDSSKIKADETSSPSMGLSQETQHKAMLEAYQKAVQDGVETAAAQLEPGEKLGHALSRGVRAEVPSPRYESARAMAAPAPGGASVGQAIVETGKVQVNAVINFVFEVTGEASRFLTGTDVTGKTPAAGDKGGDKKDGADKKIGG